MLETGLQLKSLGNLTEKYNRLLKNSGQQA